MPCPYPLLIQLLLLFGSSFGLGQTAGLVLQYTDEEIEAQRGKGFPPKLIKSWAGLEPRLAQGQSLYFHLLPPAGTAGQPVERLDPTGIFPTDTCYDTAASLPLASVSLPVQIITGSCHGCQARHVCCHIQSSHPRTSVRLQASLQQVSSSTVALLCPNALSPPPQPIPLIGLQGEMAQEPAPLLDWGGWGGRRDSITNSSMKL